MRIDFTSLEHNYQKLVENFILLDATRSKATAKEAVHKQHFKNDYNNISYKLHDMDGQEVARTWNVDNL